MGQTQAQAQGEQPQQQAGGLGILRQLPMMVMIFFLINSFMVPPLLVPHHPLIAVCERLDMHVYLTPWEEWSWDDGDDLPPPVAVLSPVGYETSARKGFDVVLTPELTESNTTLYTHVFLCRSGVSPDPAHRSYNNLAVAQYSQKGRRFLLDDFSAPSQRRVVELPDEERFFWNEILVRIVPYFEGAAPSAIFPEGYVDKGTGGYFPLVTVIAGGERVGPLAGNYTGTTLSIDVSFESVTLYRFAWESKLDTMPKDAKEMVQEANPILLGITVVVMLIHTVLDFFAFKNDISFWKNRDSMKGLSLTNVCMTVVCDVIILFYLLDRREQTSFFVIGSIGVGAAIGVWKLGRAVKFQGAEETLEYDKRAVKCLMWVLLPLVLVLAFVNLVYYEQKGWYSWVLETLVWGIHVFGFVMMTPQLFINYKLKSVAHLPWRVMTYKAVNTFIDDLFAFVDDVVFVIFLYQRYIYPVDRTRVNEYGQVFDRPGVSPDALPDDASAEPRPRAPSDPTEASQEGERSRGVTSGVDGSGVPPVSVCGEAADGAVRRRVEGGLADVD